MVSNVIGLVLTAIVMFTLSWQVTLLSLILLPVFVLPARWFGRKLQALTRESYTLNASMNTTTTERFNVSGALLVALFGRPDVEARSFGERAGRVRDIGITTAMYGRVFIVALTLVAALAQALTYGLGGTLALTGGLEPGAVVSLALLLTRLYGPLTALSNVRVDVMSALVSFERVFEVLDLKPLITERPDAVDLTTEPASVEFVDVRFAYPGAAEVSLASLEDVAVPDQSPRHPVLHGVSFRADAGQLVALVGPSGAGKTTISQLVPRIYDADSGAVLVGGIDVKDLTLQSLRDAHRGRRSGSAPVPRLDQGEPAVRAPGGHRGRADRRPAGRADLGPHRGRCRRAWTPSSGTAVTGCPAARSSGWPSRGCCSRRRPS